MWGSQKEHRSLSSNFVRDPNDAWKGFKSYNLILFLLSNGS